jgi:crotonobetainyl-CoA:carnitine CoA-transferase CaiB-like acyl-CoA transferase
MKTILSGIRVLDFTDALAGPYCTTHLAACGCEVINIERPGGKVTRSLPPFYGEYSIDYMYNHCGKKSLMLDLKATGARELIQKLAKSSDVVVENFRPGVMADFGLDYAAFQQANPSIIMCSISAWGQDGPYAGLMGVDTITQAQSGLVHMSGAPGQRPNFVGFPVSDILAGVQAFGAICASLYHRSQTGEGECIDIAMYDCLISALYYAVGDHILSQGKQEYRYMEGCFSPNFSPCGAYQGRDGYLAIFARTDVAWARLAELMNQPELAADTRFKTVADRVRNNSEVTRIIEAWLQNYERISDAAAFLQSWRMLAGPVLSLGQVIDGDPQFKARNMLVEMEHPALGPVKFLKPPLRFKNAPAGFTGPPPLVPGQHNAYVLQDILNLSKEEIDKLIADGVMSAYGETGQSTIPGKE